MEIRNHFVMNKRLKVRKGIIPGNYKSLWKAVKLAKYVNTNLNNLFNDEKIIFLKKRPKFNLTLNLSLSQDTALLCLNQQIGLNTTNSHQIELRQK